MGDGRLTDAAQELQRANADRGFIPPRIIPRRTDRRTTILAVERMLDKRYGPDGPALLRENAGAKAIHDAAVLLLTDIFMGEYK